MQISKMPVVNPLKFKGYLDETPEQSKINDAQVEEEKQDLLKNYGYEKQFESGGRGEPAPTQVGGQILNFLLGRKK